MMLRLGGIINLIISVAHLVGLFWAEQMFEATGIAAEMQAHSETHYSIPYLITIFVSIVFFIFGLYGLSADGKGPKLPYVKTVIFFVAGVYILRGAGELVYESIAGTNSLSETLFSVIALLIGMLFLFGGIRKWHRGAVSVK